MNPLPHLIFTALLTVTVSTAIISFSRIRKYILLGKPYNTEGTWIQNFKTMMLVAFGQKRMFDKPLVAMLHLMVYLGFLIVNIELVEIVIDGVFGTHRVLKNVLGTIYPVLISILEIFGVLVIFACMVFLIRRNILKIDRFQKPELQGFPFTDANTILVVEIILMVAFLEMNAADLVLQSRGELHYAQTGTFLVSGWLQLFINEYDTSSLIAIERIFWWVHIVGILWFLNYIPYSKHLHIMLAFPNTWYARLQSSGKLENMPVVTREVASMLGVSGFGENADTCTTERFGARDVTDLSWKNLLEAYTCTECGRCTQVCPANQTGKALSPRKIMMDTRDRLEELGRYQDRHGANTHDGKYLLGNYITDEEILACTTCQACVEACPVLISPLDIIIQLRRYKIMEEAAMPQSWVSAFNNIENNGAPWKFSPADRSNWTQP